jgi:hypothetical protein
MKDKLLTIFTLVMFALTLIFGASLLTIAMLVIIPIAVLRCVFSTNSADEKNEGV